MNDLLELCTIIEKEWNNTEQSSRFVVVVLLLCRALPFSYTPSREYKLQEE